VWRQRLSEVEDDMETKLLRAQQAELPFTLQVPDKASLGGAGRQHGLLASWQMCLQPWLRLLAHPAWQYEAASLPPTLPAPCLSLPAGHCVRCALLLPISERPGDCASGEPPHLS
jgi:hypothetical protein